MNRLLTLFAILFLVSFYNLQAQDIFTRTSTIHTLTYEPGGGGIGGVVAGVDWDNDGKPDLYVCNANYIDRETGELIPKIWKFEWNEVTAEWDSVWGATLPAQAQNTWTTLVAADLDKDGKPELVWTPVNFFAPDPPAPQNPNPLRVIVYEVVGDGSDNLGVDDGFGAFLPNAATTIVTDNNYELRPISLKILDIDDDGTDEIIFSDQGSNWHFGVLSVDDIPDNGSGLENWTVEASGLNDPVQNGMGSAYDVAVVGKTIYVFASTGLIYPVKYDGFAWNSSAPLTNVANEDGSFRGTVTADLDNDGTDEIILGSWSNGNVYVLKQVDDTLQTFVVADLSTIGADRLNGAAGGDLDADGKPDFVFGTRSSSVPNNAVYRVEFQGGDFTDPANYQSQIIDSLLVPAPGGTGGQLDVVYIANVDGDPADEVLYTQGYTRGVANDTTADLAIVDLMHTPVSVELETDVVPAQFYLDQNYPNPFNPSTQIKFGITEAASVDLRIYDVLGREVAVLIDNQFMSTGSYIVKLDASNLASGNYIYKIIAGGKSVSKKMQLLK